MLLPVFSGQNYSYSYEPETGDYFLFKNDFKTHKFLKGKDARLFSKQIDRFDILPEPQYKTGLMTENLIKLLVSWNKAVRRPAGRQFPAYQNK